MLGANHRQTATELEEEIARRRELLCDLEAARDGKAAEVASLRLALSRGGRRRFAGGALGIAVVLATAVAGGAIGALHYTARSMAADAAALEARAAAAERQARELTLERDALWSEAVRSTARGKR